MIIHLHPALFLFTYGLIFFRVLNINGIQFNIKKKIICNNTSKNDS